MSAGNVCFLPSPGWWEQVWLGHREAQLAWGGAEGGKRGQRGAEGPGPRGRTLQKVLWFQDPVALALFGYQGVCLSPKP